MHEYRLHTLVDITENGNLKQQFPFKTLAGNEIHDKHSLELGTKSFGLRSRSRVLRGLWIRISYEQRRLNRLHRRDLLLDMELDRAVRLQEVEAIRERGIRVRTGTSFFSERPRAQGFNPRPQGFGPWPLAGVFSHWSRVPDPWPGPWLASLALGSGYLS